MANLSKEVVIYDSTTGENKELKTHYECSVTITTFGSGTATFETSTDSGETFMPRALVNMKTFDTGYNLTTEGQYKTVIDDVDVIRVSNVTGFTKIMASIQ